MIINNLHSSILAMYSRLRQKYIALRYYLTSPSFRMLRRSRLFDPEYYLENNPDVIDSGLDPLIHYFTVGFAELRKFGPLFDIHLYLYEARMEAKNHGSLLLHFLTEGRFQGLRPNLFYDLEYYVIRNPDFDSSREDALTHFLRKGQKSGGPTSPSPYFDPDFYCHEYADAAQFATAPALAYKHFLTVGLPEKRRPSVLFDFACFDVQYYLSQDPVAVENLDTYTLVIHFLAKGRFQGLRPNLFYDPEYYASRNPDFDFSKEDVLTHFLREGQKSGGPTSPSPYFDPEFYCREYADAGKFAASPPLAYKHFLSVGLPERRRPSVLFDIDWYLDRTPILREHGFDALDHYLYLKIGSREKKSPCPLFDPEFYQKTYGIEECDDLFAHYLRAPLHEDRRPCPWFDPRFYRQTYLGAQQEPTFPLKHYLEFGLKRQLYPNKDVQDLATKPVISVLVPVYNVKIAHLNICIRSVVYQSYPHWQLCLADDCSTDERIRPLLHQWAESDPRIKVVFLPENAGIAAATNGAAKLADGSYLAFLDNDDELAPEALQCFVQQINSNPGDLYYSDEDLIGDDGRQFSIFRKPGFNSELLLCHNYVTHCVLTKKSLYEKVGGCARELSGAQDFDLFLKLSEQADSIIHIPQVLYHWRASPTSTSINHAEKHYADEAGRKSVAGAMARRGIVGEALFTDWKFFYRAKRALVSALSVSLVVNWQQPPDESFPWLNKLIALAGYKVSQVLIFATQVPSSSLIDTFAKESTITPVYKVLPEGLGPAEKLSSIQTDLQGDLVAYIDGDLDIESTDWLAALVEYGQSPEIGVVGGLIDYPAEGCDTVTPIADCTNTSPWYYARFLTDCSVLQNGRHCPQEVLGVSGDLFLTRRKQLTAPDSFDSVHFPFLLAMPDLSFRLHHQGKKNIATPYCKATINATGLTRRRHWLTATLQAEKSHFQSRWSALLEQGNPFYNPGIVSDSGSEQDTFRAWLSGSPASEHAELPDR